MGQQIRWTLQNKKSGKEVVKWMTYDEKVEYLAKNKHMTELFTVNRADPVSLGVAKPPSDFSKYVLGRIANSVPESTVGSNNRRFKIPKEI